MLPLSSLLVNVKPYAKTFAVAVAFGVAATSVFVAASKMTKDEAREVLDAE